MSFTTFSLPISQTPSYSFASPRGGGGEIPFYCPPDWCVIESLHALYIKHVLSTYDLCQLSSFCSSAEIFFFLIKVRKPWDCAIYLSCLNTDTILQEIWWNVIKKNLDRGTSRLEMSTIWWIAVTCLSGTDVALDSMINAVCVASLGHDTCTC